MEPAEQRLEPALATCYCNDLDREARKRGIEVPRVEVEVEGSFGAEGAAAERLAYHRSCPVLLTETEAQEAV